MNSDYKKLYRSLYLIRRVEEKIAQLYPEQEMRCPVHLSIGQEAVAVGVSALLDDADLAFSGHRAHAHYLAKGASPERLIAELYGKSTGVAGGRGGSMHLTDSEKGFVASTPIVGGTIPLSVGAALSLKRKNKNNICVSYLGDSAIEEGVFHESIQFAQLHKLPVLFVCENNLYASQTNISERQGGRDIIKYIEGYGVKALRAEGNDIDLVLQAANEAVSYVREGKGPAFIEFKTYRYLEHCGPYDDTKLGYRTQEEVDLWKSKDPIDIAKKKISEEDCKIIEDEVEILVEKAVKFAKDSSYPDANSLNEKVYR